MFVLLHFLTLFTYLMPNKSPHHSNLQDLVQYRRGSKPGWCLSSLQVQFRYSTDTGTTAHTSLYIYLRAHLPSWVADLAISQTRTNVNYCQTSYLWKVQWF